MRLSKIAVLFASGLILGTAGDLKAQSITVKGSDTMVILVQKWAEAYMKAYPSRKVQVTGGGSGTGIAALINGTTDIANSSRTMKDKEKQSVKNRSQILPKEYKVARDGLSIYVNDTNPIDVLTLDQIKAIYTGKISNWKQVGGPDNQITRYSRENNSGTYVFFKENVLDNQDYHPSCQNMPGTASVVNAVARDQGGIGYGGMAYGKGIKEIGVKKDAKSPAVKPSVETVKDGSYPIWRYLYQYTIGPAKGAVKDFINWEQSDDGQAIVNKVGYVSIR